jgi:hypothetical protein
MYTHAHIHIYTSIYLYIPDGDKKSTAVPCWGSILELTDVAIEVVSVPYIYTYTYVHVRLCVYIYVYTGWGMILEVTDVGRLAVTGESGWDMDVTDAEVPISGWSLGSSIYIYMMIIIIYVHMFIWICIFMYNVLSCSFALCMSVFWTLRYIV